ncbi:MAG TPA: hypothetical protein VFN67_02695 [Polyangiales bacterium]|nr:hypothetical protein [Polyangiales bacterium]
MKLSLRCWAALGLSCALIACSGGNAGDAQRGRGSPMGNPANPLVPGAGAAGNKASTSSNAPGGGLITNTSTGTTSVPPPPPVDPSAAPYAQDDTAMGGLDPAQLDMLRNASGACTVKVTNPYEGTIFPGGLVPPIIMWDGAADAAYVRFAYEGATNVSYQYAAKVMTPGGIQIPREAWNEITRRTNYLPLNVTLNTVSGSAVSSCQLHWKVAPGNMIGAIYYNTYQAPPPGVLGQGAVMRQSLGAQAEIYKQFQGPINAIPMTGPCYSCHSVSFNGTTLVASYHDYSGQKFNVEKFDITKDVQPEPKGTLDNANFGALTPDGKKILAMGNPQCTAGSDTFPRKPNNFPLVEGPAVARLLDTQTGEDLHAKGLNPEFYMWMPQFSPDGKKVVFSHGKPDGMGGSDRRELATMDFDYATNTFSNLKVIVTAGSLPGIPAPSLSYAPGPAFGGVLACGAEMCGPDGMPNTCMSGGDQQGGAIPGLGGAIPGIPGDVGALPSGSCTGPCYPAWPFFTPDGKAVVYALTSEPDYSSAFPGRDQASNSELWYVDLELNQTVRMDNANRGLVDIDAQSNYFPTVMPVAVGGYFWVFWTSMRAYGNKVPGREAGAPVVVAAAEAIKKRIWATAIKPRIPLVENDDPTLVDPSAPGFYLEGQSESGNVRAFAALNPCLADGASCTSGLDCCCGYCLQNGGSTTGTCSCEVPMCAKINEKCTKDADCCPPESPKDPVPQCLGGFCGFIMLN